MKLDLSMKMLGHEGLPIRRLEPPKPGEEPKDLGEMELQHILFAAANSVFPDENPSPEELYKRGKLARKVKDKGEKNFSAEEITLMLKSVAKRYKADPLFVLYVSEILDPDKFKEAT